MKRRILALLLPLAVLLSLGTRAVDTEAQSGALLPRARVYAGQFADVTADSWYYESAVLGYEYGLFEGRGDGFAPDAKITVAELLTLSARLRAAYEGDTLPAGVFDPWYAPYVAYLDARGLLDRSIAAFDAPATRAQLAAIFALSLPGECYDERNDPLVSDAYASGQFIADVDESTPYCAQILWMYRQGLLTGTDESGSYRPGDATTRAETAALVTRIVDPSLRVTLDWRIVPAWSAAGTTLMDLVEAPPAVGAAPAFDDDAAIDALVRRMLATGEHTIELDYPRPVTESDARTLARVFSERVKRYCEQMYNTVECQYYLNSGRVSLGFYATACLPDKAAAATARERAALMEEAAAQLARYRDETMAEAIRVHDMLWETGRVTAGMSQYEVAKAYYKWLCDRCGYDTAAVADEYSLSHLAYGALLRGSAVCDGYTGAYDLLLKLEGIACRALSNDAHIWTVAVLDGTEYHIDVTWGDREGGIDWSFFGMSEAEARAAHDW